MNHASAQFWIRIHGLSQEYWRPKVIFAIASSLGTPIYIDFASNRSPFDREFGHYVRVLIDIYLLKEMTGRILIGRVGFAFFVEVEYERIPEICNYCKNVGHSEINCRRKQESMENMEKK